MAIINIPTITPQTEEELKQGVPGLNIRPLPEGVNYTPPVEQPRTQTRQKPSFGESLIRIGQAFQGLDASALAMEREQAKREMEQERIALERQPEQNKLLDEAIKQSPNITEARKNYLYSLPYEQKQAAFLKFAQPNEKKLTQAIQDYEYFSNLDKDARLAFMQASGRGAYSPELIAGKRIAQSPGGLDLTSGEKKLDEAFANTLVKWEGGEKQQAASNITNLENKLALISQGANVSGPEYAFIPEGLKPVLAPGSTGFKDEISDIVFQSLRATLGAQFTEREGQRLVAATFNQSLPEEYNIPRLQRLLAKTKAIYNDKQSKIDYYNESGTLKGYVGEASTFNDILDAVFFDELSQMTNEEILDRYNSDITSDERLTILRYAKSLQPTSE
jgi:hypothetical protein|tara:strand:+ start:401 stop:1570 length:1170 start_codon:yes stop_codon:yes gene_type:complete